MNAVILLGNVKLYVDGNNSATIIRGEHLSITDDILEANILIKHITYKFWGRHNS